MASLAPKRNYRCEPALQQFFSGGPLVVSSDGSFFVCACDESIKIIDSSNASLRSSIDAESDAVTALALSPDDKLLFSAGHNRHVRVWDLSTFKCVRSWKGHDGPVMGMACHPSGGLLATAGADRKVLVWDVDGGFCTHYFKGHKGVVSTILFHPDSDKPLLFSGSDDTTVRVWDILTKKCVATLNGHNSAVTSMTLSEDGETLLSAGRDKVVMLWGLQDYSCKKTVLTYEAIEAVCPIRSGMPFASALAPISKKSGTKSGPQGTYFITVGERGIVRIWNSERSVCVFEQKSSDVTVNADTEDAKRGFSAAIMLPLDQGLLCVTVDQQLLVYSPLKQPEGTLELVLSRRLVGYNEEIVDMKFLGNEEQFLAVATNTEQVRVYDLESKSCHYVLTGHSEIVLSIDTAVSSSGKALIVTGSKDKSVRLWDSESGQCLGVGTGHMGGVAAVALSKKGKPFFVSGSSDRTLKVWNIDDLPDDAEQPINLKAKAVVVAHEKDINCLAIAPNDSLVCSGSQDRTACVWTLPELVSKVSFKGHKRAIWCVEFSPVDQCVITASGDKTVKIWAISDGSCLKTFEGHTSSVLRASFLTRGTQFVSCGADGLVKLWMVNVNESIATYDQHEDKANQLQVNVMGAKHPAAVHFMDVVYAILFVWALAVGKKTEMLATGGSDALVNLWYDSTASDKEEAFRKEEEGVLKGQELDNAILDADYTKAIQIAFALRRPHKLFELFAQLCRKREPEDQIKKALDALSKENFRSLLEYLREWNTEPKLCHVAQFVLFRVFSIVPPTEIIEIKGIAELLEGLLPYSQRHFSRIDRLVRSTFLLDYTLTGMSVVEPEIQGNVSSQSISKLAAAEDANEDSQERGLKRKASSKKRKSNKHKDGTHKKVKAVAYTSIIATS